MCRKLGLCYRENLCRVNSLGSQLYVSNTQEQQQVNYLWSGGNQLISQMRDHIRCRIHSCLGHIHPPEVVCLHVSFFRVHPFLLKGGELFFHGGELFFRGGKLLLRVVKPSSRNRLTRNQQGMSNQKVGSDRRFKDGLQTSCDKAGWAETPKYLHTSDIWCPSKGLRVQVAETKEHFNGCRRIKCRNIFTVKLWGCWVLPSISSNIIIQKKCNNDCKCKGNEVKPNSFSKN